MCSSQSRIDTTGADARCLRILRGLWFSVGPLSIVASVQVTPLLPRCVLDDSVYASCLYMPRPWELVEGQQNKTEGTSNSERVNWMTEYQRSTGHGKGNKRKLYSRSRQRGVEASGKPSEKMELGAGPVDGMKRKRDARWASYKTRQTGRKKTD